MKLFNLLFGNGSKATESQNTDQSLKAQNLILEALKKGEKLTSNSANKIGHTVDSRCAISRLRKKGYNIVDAWVTGETGKRFKVYWLE